MRVRIEKAIYGGAGLARLPEQDEAPELAGKTMFVPNTLPGELVEVRLAEDRRSFANGELVRVDEPSPERTRPGCEYFPTCGGCQYQHATYPFQLQMKAAILRETMQRAHVPLPEELGVVHGKPWGYRNRVRLHIRHAPAFALCYRELGSHNELPVDHCPIAAPLLQRCIAAVSSLGDGSLLRECDEIEFFTNAEESELLVALWARRAAPQIRAALEPFASALQAQIPELRGVGLFATADRSERLLAHWGAPALEYTVNHADYRVSLGSFFQVNRFLAPELVSLVTEGRSGSAAWDLFAGVGLFARALQFDQVVAVESAASSAADLRINLPGPGRRVVRAETLQFLRGWVRGAAKREPPPELIVLDPPRAGLGKEICTLLAQVAAPGLVYVSCDPATLSRDLQSLLQSGYRLQTLSLVDLFPQTFHLETVAVLTRG